MSIAIRAGVAADALDVSRLLTRLGAESPFLGDYGLSVKESEMRTIVLAPAELVVTMVARSGTFGPLHGYAQAIAGPYSTTRHVGTVTVAVSPDQRQQGIGSALLRAVTAAAKGSGFLRLRASVWDSNHHSLKLFQKAGYELQGRLPGQFRGLDGICHDEMVFSLELEERETIYGG